MASTKCWKCKERPASRIGGFCHTCWVAAGKPDRERAEAMRAGTVPAEAVPLTTDLDDTLPAMRFVIGNPSSADTTHQQKAMREWRETSPTTFFNRLADLEKTEMAAKGSSAEPVEPELVEPEPTNPALDEVLDLVYLRWCLRHKAALVGYGEREGLA